MARLVLVLEVLTVVVLVSWWEDKSLTAQAIERTGDAGWLVVVALAGACLVSLADSFFNDFLHRSPSFLAAKHLRHLGFMVIALLLAVLGVLVAATSGFTPLLFVYWLNAGLAACIALLDAFARIRAC